VSFDALVELVVRITVTFAALMPDMLAMLVTLARLTLRTFPAFVFLMFPVLPVLVLPMLAPVVVYLNDAVWSRYGDGRRLESGRRRAG